MFSIKTLVVLFLNTGIWLGGTFLFIYLEGTNEAEHKCGKKIKRKGKQSNLFFYQGVKRVQRNFIDTLWEETLTLDEHEWKSSARKKIMKFEEQLHEGW